MISGVENLGRMTKGEHSRHHIIIHSPGFKKGHIPWDRPGGLG
jgi:hypothetical protein